MFDIYYFFLHSIVVLMFIFITYQLLGVRFKFKKTIFILLTILIVYWSIILPTNLSETIKNSILILSIIIGLRIHRVSDIFPIFVCTVIANSTVLILHDMVIKSLLLILNISSSTIYDSLLGFFLISVILYTIGIIILVLLKHYKLTLFDEGQTFDHEILNNNKNNRKKIFNIYNRIILLITIQMLLLTLYFTINDITILNPSSKVLSIKHDLITLIIGLAIIIINIISIFTLKNISILIKEQYHYKIKEKEFAQIEQQDKIIRQFKHDLFNHFKLLEILAEEEKYEELKSYLLNYHEEVKSNSITVNTGLIELDILLNSKINIAQMQNIIVKYKCKADIKCINRHIISLISIIGNVLDNAIEASEKSEERIINIEIKEDALDYMFIIKNSTNNDELMTSDILLKEGYSTKGHDRGTGLSVVNRLVKKYKGSINISNDNNNFVVNIDLPKYQLNRN